MGRWDNASSVVAAVRNSHALTSKVVKKYGVDHLEDIGGDGSRRVPDFVGLTWRDWAPLELWNRYKQVYAPDPGLTRELIMSGSADVLSSVDLRALPHPDPLYVLSEGIDLTHTDGKPGRLVGFHVSGSIRTDIDIPVGRICSTQHPDVNGLHLMSISEVHDGRGNVVDWDHCHLTLPFMPKFTIDDLVKNCMQSFVSFIGDDAPDDVAVMEYLTLLCRVMLPHILYTVASNVELAPERSTTAAPPRGKVLGDRPFRPVKLIPMGMRMGAALTSWRRAQRDKKTPLAPTGKTVAPHIRRAHFHTFMKGPGRQVSDLRFLPPIDVNIKGVLATPTVHPVNPKKGN